MRSTINSLAVHTYGNKKKQPIIFIHGFPFDYKMWCNHMEALSENYYCIAYDVRGLGESYVGDGQYTMEFFVDDLYSIMHEMSLKNPIVCGMSMGGYIALRAVERDQSRFKALILMDTKSQADNDEGKIKRAAAINEINTNGLNNFLEGFITNCFSSATIKNNPEKFECVLERAKKQDPLGVKGCLLAMISRTDTTAYLEKIEIPTLLMVGEKDTLTPPQVMKDMAAQIDESEFAPIPHAGHMAPVENPGVVNNIIASFLERRFKK
jgi:3-oxoadipate enol-lactonase